MIPDQWLNPRLTFETFIVGPSNQVAYAACRTVADAPARGYNPLFLTGGMGLGKTHLLHATGQALRDRHPLLTLLYVPSERFLTEYAHAHRDDRLLEFRARYRRVDILLVDDIQHLWGLDEFFRLFSAHVDAHKQIVCSSNEPLDTIPPALLTYVARRLEGLVADLQAPDGAMHTAILRRTADAAAVPLPDEAARLIADPTGHVH